MRIKLIACKTLWREISALCAGSTHDIDITYLPPMCESDINAYINKIEGNYDAVVLAMGLCSFPEDGLSSVKHRLVMPKAHNCVSILLGNPERYREISDSLEGDILWVHKSFEELNLSDHISGEKHSYDYKCLIQSPVCGYYRPNETCDREFMADLRILSALVNGKWDIPEILILEKGELASPSFDYEVISKE